MISVLCALPALFPDNNVTRVLLLTQAPSGLGQLLWWYIQRMC